LKILFSMIRSPKLCDLFSKAERKRVSKKEMEKVHENSIKVLLDHQFQAEKADQFVGKVHA